MTKALDVRIPVQGVSRAYRVNVRLADEHTDGR